MKATHTPGLWTAVETFDFFKTKRDRVEFAEILKTKRERMDIVSQTEEKLHCVAIDVLPSDARLICCAPDLLAALNRLIQSLPEDSNEYPDSASARQVFDSIRFAREAISKATGGAA